MTASRSSSVPITPAVRMPSATRWAPVRVEVSSRTSGQSSEARAIASASTTRPSASVLSISACLPLEGHDVGRPVGGAAGQVLGDRHGGGHLDGQPSWATRHTVAITAAAPAMSLFISSMPAAGLIEMPPLSNVMPLPTSAIFFRAPEPE